MAKWEDEFKKYLVKRINDAGIDVDINDIKILDNIKIPVDLTIFSLYDLASMYAFAITKEDFEQANIIKEELRKRNCEIKLEIDDNKNTGMINIYLIPQTAIAHINIEMKIINNELMIDFEKENF